MVKVEHHKDIQYKSLDLKEIGQFLKGNSKYTAKYCFEHKGEYPVYSANTKKVQKRLVTLIILTMNVNA